MRIKVANCTLHLLTAVRWLDAGYSELTLKTGNPPPLRILNQFTVFTATFSCSHILTHKAKMPGSWYRGCLQLAGCNRAWGSPLGDLRQSYRNPVLKLKASEVLEDVM